METTQKIPNKHKKQKTQKETKKAYKRKKEHIYTHTKQKV
jgi:hypothetical protein